MMFFNVPKMMHPDLIEPGVPVDPSDLGDPDTKTVETYEKNMADFNELVANGPSQYFPTDVTGNAITEYASDHTEEDQEGTAGLEDTLIKNHDYTLIVAVGGDSLVKEAYEDYDAAQRAAITYNKEEELEDGFEPPEEPIEPVNPAPNV